MPATINRELAATVLVETLFTTDEKACEKYDVSVRTLRRWRAMLPTDPVLASFVRTKKAALDAQWADVLPAAMREAAQTIAEISVAIRTDPLMRKNPFALEKLAGALKLCADVYYTGKVIDARIAPKNRPEAGLLGSESATSESQAVN